MTKILRPLSLGLIILAGGRSTRMGRDKTALPWRDTDLLTDLLLRSQAYPFTERLLSINRPYESSHLPAKLARTVRLVIDNYPDCGPLGGMEAALYSGQCDFYLVLSVDLPFYDFAPAPDLVKLLRRQPTLQAIIPRTENGQDQPLAALYSRQLLPAITDHLQKGNYRLRHLYQDVPAAYVDETFRSALYFNINTPEAYEAAKGRDTNSRRQVPVVTLTAPKSGDGKTTAAAAAITPWPAARPAPIRTGPAKPVPFPSVSAVRQIIPWERGKKITSWPCPSNSWPTWSSSKAAVTVSFHKST